jgi:hypothetical protein
VSCHTRWDISWYTKNVTSTVGLYSWGLVLSITGLLIVSQSHFARTIGRVKIRRSKIDFARTIGRVKTRLISKIYLNYAAQYSPRTKQQASLSRGSYHRFKFDGITTVFNRSYSSECFALSYGGYRSVVLRDNHTRSLWIDLGRRYPTKWQHLAPSSTTSLRRVYHDDSYSVEATIATRVFIRCSGKARIHTGLG